MLYKLKYYCQCYDKEKLPIVGGGLLLWVFSDTENLMQEFEYRWFVK